MQPLFYLLSRLSWLVVLLVEMSSQQSTRVYVGDLGSGGSKPELEREFERYGTLKSVWVARNPPGWLVVFLQDTVFISFAISVECRVCLH